MRKWSRHRGPELWTIFTTLPSLVSHSWFRESLHGVWGVRYVLTPRPGSEGPLLLFYWLGSGDASVGYLALRLKHAASRRAARRSGAAAAGAPGHEFARRF